MKKSVLLVISALFLFPCVFAYATWTEYKNIRWDMDFDGDFINEIIVEAKYGAGSSHYIEDLRIFKDTNPELTLIFSVITLDRTWGIEGVTAENNSDMVSAVEFSEPDATTGNRDIIVKSKTIFYKDAEFNHLEVEREEDIGVKVYRWNGNEFFESESQISAQISGHHT